MKNEVNKKLKVKKFWYLCLILIIVQFLVEVRWGLELLIFGINSSFIRLLLVLILILTPIHFFDYNKNKIEVKTFVVCMSIIATCIVLLYLFIFSSHQYYYFYSPYENNKRVLILDETSILGSGTGNFYERKNIIFIKRMNQSISYDYSPFSSETATIKWLDENSVQIDYINNSVGHHNIEVVKFN